MNRHERRRQQRAQTKQPIIVVEGIIAASTGHRYEARPMAQLPPKQLGVHRWIAAGSWIIDRHMVEAAFNADLPKMLDNENLLSLGIGCWDCEQSLGVISADSTCPALGDD